MYEGQSVSQTNCKSQFFILPLNSLLYLSIRPIASEIPESLQCRMFSLRPSHPCPGTLSAKKVEVVEYEVWTIRRVFENFLLKSSHKLDNHLDCMRPDIVVLKEDTI